MCVLGPTEPVVKESVSVATTAEKPKHVNVKCRLGQRKQLSESGQFLQAYWCVLVFVCMCCCVQNFTACLTCAAS